ncbi:MAG: hypothetical protein A2Y62_11985 [Candidatus Fischerbacteria bacterium RBG_13_37_8]|uniref:VWA domain-containing protein n=1 Tax=Candidatus Fischerbacteria bacterium RBG_13_37_8 TaxID=1817863 RepID=A0A1F5VIM2_9BACT|nr:MAG: hypothetical protein A2Y62_11985 [Candidatus Fischerbacteria bacterium RBG_13_37_8]
MIKAFGIFPEHFSSEVKIMNITRKKIALVLVFSLFLFFNLLLNSQEAAKKEQNQESTLPKPYVKIEVVITNIDIMVTDKFGEPITGLRPEHFEIYEDGKLQKLKNFYEVKGLDVYLSVPDKETGTLKMTEKPLEEPTEDVKNRIIFYFDGLQIHPLNKTWVIKKLENFIKNNFTSSVNEGMVISLDRELKVVQGFTTDSSKILQAAKEVSQQSSDMMLKLKSREDLKEDINRIIENADDFDKSENYERSLDLARNYVQYAENDLLHSLKSLDSLVNYLSGIPGRKILVYMSDGLPTNPAEELFTYVDQAYPQGNALSRAMDYDETRLFKEITTRCNAHNIAIYTINAMGLDTTMTTADQRTQFNLYSKGFGVMRSQSRFQNSGLTLMADDTGGLAIVNANNIETGLKKIEKSLQNYYSLGFSSPNKDNNKTRSIKVEIKGIKQDYNVRVRRNYKLLSDEEKIEDTVMSRLFFRTNVNPLKISAQVFFDEFRISDDKQIPVSIKIFIPLKNVTLIQKGNEYQGQIEVFSSIKDSKDNVSPCYKMVHDIRIPEQDYKVALESNYPYVVEMKVQPDSYLFSLAVRDTYNQNASFVQFEKTIK